MNIHALINIFETTLKDIFINPTFYFQKIEYTSTEGESVYPFFLLEIDNVVFEPDATTRGLINYNCNLYFLDKINHSDTNYYYILSENLEKMKFFFTHLQDKMSIENIFVLSNVTFTPIYEETVDYTNGWLASFTITFANSYNECNIPTGSNKINS